MTENQVGWSRKRDELVLVIKQQGFPRELGEQIAKQLGSPKAMDRMIRLNPPRESCMKSLE